MSDFQPPTVELAISIDPNAYSFSQPVPPKIRVTATSCASHPITIFTWRTALDPASALISNAFVITDLTTGSRIETSIAMLQRSPFKRTRGSPDETYLTTLEPNAPLEATAQFGRPDQRPQPKAIVERGWELDEQGRETRTRRSVRPTGVDGLEPGHEYRVDFDTEALQSWLWARDSKANVLVDHQGAGSDVQDYPWSPEPLEFSTQAAVVRIDP